MKQLLIGGAMCLATLALIFAGSARAEPPPSMTYTELSVPVIVCDSHDEMETVVQAIRNGFLVQTLAQFAKLKDAHNEPVCMYSPIGPVVFGESEHIGRLRDGDRTIDTWLSHVGNRNADFWLLWGQLVEETPA